MKENKYFIKKKNKNIVMRLPCILILSSYLSLPQTLFINNTHNKIIKNLEGDKILKYYNTTFRYELRIKKKNRFFQKMINNYELPKDIFGLRIIYSNQNLKQDEFISYLILNNLERNNIIIKNTYNDYIVNKKNNGYQSLHINVLQKLLFIIYHIEIQIRSEEMDYYINLGPPNEYHLRR